MSAGIIYDETWTRRVEAIYSTSDVIAQRQAVLDALKPRPGERIADLGAGPGMLAASLAAAVGPEGCVRGVDISQSMIDLARRRGAPWPWIELEVGSVTSLPYADGEFDAAVSVQVCEYVEDVTTALAELRRVLRAGGRALILDTDWDTLIWNTHDLPRLRRIMAVFEGHCPHPRLARRLSTLLAGAGLPVEWQGVHTILNPALHADTYSHGIIDFIGAYVKGKGGPTATEVAAWRAELHDLGATGGYFFSLNRYLFLVRRR